MATTEIHAITSTPDRALGYCVSDKVVPFVSEEAINEEIPYELFEENGAKYIRYFTLNSFQNCDPNKPYSTYKDTQEKWQGVRYKNGGKRAKNGKEPVMWHMHQSFHGWEVSPETANEIGRKLAAEVFKGFTVTISTHGNTDNIHNHFIICAWDKNGKKWHDCHATKRLIRKVSDRLCEEYGLSVLVHTRDMKLNRYEDADGKVHYYEPTERKNKLIRKRTAGEIQPDDVNSYRNALPYEVWKKKNVSNRDEIKADIDAILPSCRSYEELLLRLRDLGYRIKDKKKNGDWFAHISFQAPGHEKATREDKIGEDGFYIRESLTDYIEGRAAMLEWERSHTVFRGQEPVITVRMGESVAQQGTSPLTAQERQKVIPYFAEYEYGKTNLAEINDDYRAVRDKDGNFRSVERTPTEKMLLSDIRIKDSQVRGLLDTTQLHKIIAKQNEQRHQKQPYLSKTQEQCLVTQIQSSFRCLQYTEQHGIYSYQQIIDLYAAHKAKYDATVDHFTKAEEAIEQLREILLVPQKLAALEEKIESRCHDVNYILEEYNGDKKMIAEYRAIMKRYRIDTQQGHSALERKVADFDAKQNRNRSYMAKIMMQMSELENCIRTFDRIDTECGRRNEQAMQSFDALSGKQRIEKSQRRLNLER